MNEHLKVQLIKLSLKETKLVDFPACIVESCTERFKKDFKEVEEGSFS